MFICQNSEGVHAYLLKCCRSTYTFVRMLKVYMVRGRLGTREQEQKFDTFAASSVGLDHWISCILAPA